MKFAIKNLLRQKKISLLFGITIMIMAVICYIFLALLYDPYFALDVSYYSKMMMGSATTLFVVMFTGCLIIYTNIYVLENKNQEISLMKICGMTNKRFIFYLFYQNTCLYFIGSLVGILLGILITPSMINYLYVLININADVYILKDTLFQTILMMSCLYVISLILNIGYVYRGNIIKMLNGTKQNKYRKATFITLSSRIYIIIYLCGLLLTIFNEHQTTAYIIFSVIGAIGTYGIIRYVIPEFIEKKKSTKWLNQVDQLIVYGEIFLKLKYTVLFIQIFMIVSIIMVTLVCFNLDNSIEMYRMIIAYIIMLPMIMFCMTYKNLMMNHQKKKSLQLIHKMGMTKIHQLTLLKKEWLLFYMMVSLLPGLYIIVIFIKFYILSHMSFTIIAVIMGYFICNVLISMLICYYSTKQYLKEDLL
ncbi:FtsX-like permease family protein [Massilimicrobiota sp. An80]|uniref:FtsX-like permease family protein n=1 Tax=Massilimicrobiota sp. An80 TaxID=1965658 RepID=UPI000B4513BB|nr:FtsX-like permease family protein [Massilimicrobiota sp. An80]OUN37776.1 hypothetical protein B5G32_03120 [Massilimicrobiota sp. An80]